jgi:FkbM family methyltransferase
MKPEDPLTLKEVNRIPGVKPYYVGSNHYDWCFSHEGEQVNLMADIMTKKRGNCLVVDVGMNDGFYTTMAAAFGCQVYSFELQRRCIELAQMAIHKNNFFDNVNIFQRPVSRTNGEIIEIPFPSSEYCDGSFTFSGQDQEGRTHSHEHRTLNRTFLAVSLYSFIPKSAHIDILKVDVEGHETEVLVGALNIFKEHRIGEAIVELGGAGNYNNVTELLDVYRQIVSYGYTLTTLNCKKERGDPDTFGSYNFQSFIDYFNIDTNSKWRCWDLKIHL